ncbi:MAG: EAL domain-containing protein [Negativicutes bacterium]|nr:EAL domain-containing protein [Negativicutes bacterium]
MDTDRKGQQGEAEPDKRIYWEKIFDSLNDPIMILDLGNRIINCNQAMARLAGVSVGELLDKSCCAISHEDGRQPGNCPLHRVQVSGAREAVKQKVKGRWFNVVVDPVFDDNGKLAGVVHVMYDVTAVEIAEAKIRRQIAELLENDAKIRSQNTALVALAETALGLMDESSRSDDVLQTLIARAADLVGASHGAVYLYNRETGMIDCVAGIGVFKDSVNVLKVELGQGVVGRVIETGEMIVIDDYQNWEHRLHGEVFDSIQMGIQIPLKDHAQVVGTFSLGFMKTGRRLSEDEISLLTRFGELASIAVQNARLVASLRQELEERTRAESTLWEIFNAVNDAIFIHDAGCGSLLDLNQKACEMFGYSRAEFLQGNLSLISPGNQSEALGWIKKAVEVGPQLFEWSMKDKTGKMLSVEVNLRSAVIAGQNRALAVVRDVTARKATERALVREEERYRLALEAINDAVMDYDIVAGTWAFSPGWSREYGLTLSEGDNIEEWRSLVHPDDQLRHKKLREDYLTRRTRRYEGEFRIMMPGGEYVWVQATGKAIFNDVGRPVRMIIGYANVNERRWHEEKIQKMAYFDGLTGLPNRSYLSEHLQMALEAGTTDKAKGAVLYIDLDDLKPVNDAFGHTYGDSVIKTASQRIAAVAGEGTFVARIAGDEFIVILPDRCDRGQVAGIAAAMIRQLGEEYEIAGERLHVSGSIGIAFYPGDGMEAEEILKKADNALFSAKAAGKNCWRFYDPAMLQDAYERMVLTNSLRYAEERGELSLHYQPQVTTDGGTVVGFEALLRWQSPEHGSVSPVRFIPLAEKSRLILPIGRWVLREACRFARRLSDIGRGDLKVAVNISPVQLAAGDFVVTVKKIMAEAGVEPSQLEFEITENVLLVSLEDGTRKLGELNALGVRLSLDDFGTGYASLTYLRNLPVQTLKVDKSFIDGITLATDEATLVRSIIQMAHDLRMNVVAEGVETTGQRSHLSTCGCDLIQGYLFSRPVPEEEAVALLAPAYLPTIK